jgi:Myb-like DNA-binding domain
MPLEPSYLSPRVNNYAPSRMASRFHSVRSLSSGMMLSPAASSPYRQSQFYASPATLVDTPIGSPMQPDFNDSETYAYFQTPQMVAQQPDDVHSGYASPSVLQRSPDNVPHDYYGQSPLVSPPITPMESQTPYAGQMSSNSINIEFDDRSVEYPMSPYTPTYSQHLLPPQQYEDSRRPASAGRHMPQREIYSNGAMSGIIPLKRAVSLNSSRFAKSLSPSQGTSLSSPPPSKRPTYSKWTMEEDNMLRTAISIHGTSKWSLVASMVKGRTAMQCSTRWQGALNTTIHKGKWEPEEDRILVAAVDKWRVEHPPHSSSYDSDDEGDQSEAIPWGIIASMLPRRRTGIQCQARWSEALDPTVRKGKWTTDEDEMLYKGVSEFGQCWIKVATKVRGRTQRQIRTRWMQIRGRDKGWMMNN